MSVPKLYLKNEVHINGAHFYPEMVKIVNVIRETAPALQGDVVWITSANDGQHMQGSLHYKNRAYDIRTKNIVGIIEFPLAARSWAERIQVALGDDYDVVLEKDHIHVEFQPKES